MRNAARWEKASAGHRHRSACLPGAVTHLDLLPVLLRKGAVMQASCRIACSINAGPQVLCWLVQNATVQLVVKLLQIMNVYEQARIGAMTFLIAEQGLDLVHIALIRARRLVLMNEVAEPALQRQVRLTGLLHERRHRPTSTI